MAHRAGGSLSRRLGKFLKVAGDDLSLYVRHGAWLGAAPEKAESDKSKAPSKTRAQRLKDTASDEDFEPDMPDAGAAEYLLGHFWAAGPTMGDAVITNGELRDYQSNMGITLSPWECNTLRRLSVDYLNESHRATKRDCPAPWQEGEHGQTLKEVDARDAIRALAKL